MSENNNNTNNNLMNKNIFKFPDTSKIVFCFRNSLSNLLGTIKLNYNFYPATQQNLNIIIEKLEELILSLYNPDYFIQTSNNNSNEENKNINNINDKEKKLFELFYLFISINTNSTFYELFLKFLIKFLKKLFKLDKKKVNLHLLKFQKYYLVLYSSLINKKFDYVGVQSDWNSTFYIAKCLTLLVKLFYEHKINYDKIKPKELFLFLLETNTNLFNISISKNGVYLTNDKFNKILIITFEIIIKDLSYSKEIMEIIEIILDKIISISKIKDDLSNKIDDYEESFHVDTLLLCLKLICKILKTKELCNLFSYNHKLKLTKGLIELSFWDNPNIVDYTCKILILIFKLSISLDNFSIRKEVEKLIDYIFLRHFKNYYEYLEDKNNTIKETDKVIKLSVLEILSRNFNEFIETEDSLPIFYFINDVYKIRFNIINEILKAIHKYFDLNNPSFNYLKNSFIITYQIIFNKIFFFLNRNEDINNLNNSIISKIEEFSEYWDKKLKLIKEGNLKELIKHFSEEYNLVPLNKSDKFESLNPENQKKYQELARTVALLIRYSNYVNIENLFEIMAEKNPFSNLILKEYSKTYNFKSYNIIKAMNLFMSTFALKGESDNIYNFICAFGTKYYEDNKDIYEKNKLNKNVKSIYFKSDEEVTQFAYSIIILNTDLHNPNVANKMNLEEFIKNNQSSGLFKDVPEDYFKEIYQDIKDNELKKAYPRNNNYSKESEIYLNLLNLENYLSFFPELDYFNNNSLFDIFNEESTFLLTKENYPYLNLFNKIKIFGKYNDILEDNSENNYNKNNLLWLNYAYTNLYDEILPSIINLPGTFLENNTELILNLFEKICDISLKLNRKEIIEKIIVSINSLINKNNKNINMYNLFFRIVLKYSQDFHTQLEMFYKAILDLINLNLKEEENSLHTEYIEIIDDIIEKAFNIIANKRKNKTEGVGFFNLLLFGDSSDQRELTFEEYKENIYKKLKFDLSKTEKKSNMIKSNSTENLNYQHNKLKNNYGVNEEEPEFNNSSSNLNLGKYNSYDSQNDNNNDDNNSNSNDSNNIEDEKDDINKDDIEKLIIDLPNTDTNKNFIRQIENKKEKISKNNSNEKKLNKLIIDVKMILKKIKIQEEEFIFFVTYATSKILEYQDQYEIYISLIFLNEILKNIPEKQFGKIWPNIFNIFKTKMQFSKVNEDNIFEVLFFNYFLTQIIKDYFCNILNEDYNQILETYEEISSVELLLIILEYNDLFIKSAIKIKKNLSPQNIENIIFLLYKLFLQLSKNITNLNNNYMLNTKNGQITINQMNKVISLFNNVLLTLKPNDILYLDCGSRISNILKLLYDNNIAKIFFELNKKVNNVSELISILSKIVSECIDITGTSLKEGKKNNMDENKLNKLKEKNEFYNSLFIFLGQFTMKCSLIEDEKIQKLFFKQMSFFLSKPLPHGYISKAINILQEWHQCFAQLNIKYKNFWRDVIQMFYAIFMNNPAIQNNTTEIEKLWTLLIKKYMISFNDENKINNNYSTKEEIETIKKIYIMVESIVHKITNSQKLNWFESTKNMIKLYFPEILLDSK